MDLLRSLGSAAVSSIVQRSGLNNICTLTDKVDYFEGRTIWSLWDGIARDDGRPVSVFIFESGAGQKRNLLPLAKNALRKLRTVRHPDVLKFVDVLETDSSIQIVTERVRPLGQSLPKWSSKTAKEKEEWLIWGLHRVSIALAFINDSCSSTHGNLRIDSVFITASGEWRLGCFDLLSNAKDDAAVLYTLGSILPDSNTYAPPEVKKTGWSTLKEHHPSVADAYALGLLIHSVFNPTHGLPPTCQPPHPPPNTSSRGAIPTYLFPTFKKLLNPNPKTRLSPAAFLEIGMSANGAVGPESGFFANNHLVKVCSGLDNFSIASEVDKALLLKSLKESASSFPSEFASHRVLPSLVSALQFGGASASSILPLVIQLGANVDPKEYSKVVLDPIIKLYASPERGTRMALLDSLDGYVEKLDKPLVSDKIWPNLQTGFADTVPVIREATVKAIGSLYPKFSDRILNNDLLRHLAKLQMDPEPSIRTNTCILIGRMAPSLGYNTKRKVLVPAFTRAIKDVFVHARVAGLMAFMACVDCFDVEDVAARVVPCVAGALLDKEKLVRDQAFKAMDLFVKRLETHAASMPETAQSEDSSNPLANPNINIVSPSSFGGQGALVNSAAGAAGALAGWAMSSLSKKLVPGDLQSTLSALPSDIDRPLSAPVNAPNPSSAFNGKTSSALSSPGIDATTASKPHTSKSRGMQLGAHKTPHGTNASLAASIALEAEAELEADGANAFDAWGGDLMDVNADEGDWNAFESAPASSSSAVAAKRSAADRLGFDLPEISPGGDDDAWGDMNDGSTSDSRLAEFDAQTTYPTLHLSPSPSIAKATSNKALSPIATPRSLSPQPTPSTFSNTSSPPARHEPLPSVTSTISTATMNKEEKAAEMARRKEERRLRIAQLKEQKKAATKI